MASTVKNQISIAIEATAHGLQQTFDQLGTSLKKIASDIKLSNTEMKAYGESLEALSERHKSLSEQAATGAEKVRLMEQVLETIKSSAGETSEAYKRYAQELNIAKTQQVGFEEALRKSQEAVDRYQAEISKLAGVDRTFNEVVQSAKRLDQALAENAAKLKALGDSSDDLIERSKLLADRRELLAQRFKDESDKAALLEAELGRLKQQMADGTTNVTETSEAYQKLEKELSESKVKMSELSAESDKNSAALREAQIAADLAASGLEKFGRSYQDIEQSSKRLDAALALNSTKLAAIGDAAENSAKRVGVLAEKKELLAAKASDTGQKVSLLKDEIDKLDRAMADGTGTIDKTDKEYQDLEQELSEAAGEYNTLSAEIREADSALRQNMISIDLSAKGLQELGRHISDVGRALAPLSTAAAAGIAAIAKVSIDYESAFAGVKKTMDATDEELKKMSDSIIELSKHKPIEASDIARIAELGAQLGISKDRLVDFSGVVADLDVATDLNLEQASKDLAQFANIMGTSQGDFDRIGSTIVDLGNHFATTETDILAMSMRLASAGADVKMSESDVMAFATALSSLGLKAEMAGSAFSKVFSKEAIAATKGLEDFNKVSDETGMSFKELDLMMHNNTMGFKELSTQLGLEDTQLKAVVNGHKDLANFSEVAGISMETFAHLVKGASLSEKEMGEVSARTGKSVAEVANALGDGTGGASWATALFIKGLSETNSLGESSIAMLSEMGITELRLSDALRRAGGSWESFVEALDMGNKAWDENTALTTEAEKRYETFESQLKMFKNEAIALGISLGTQLLPFLRDILKGASDLVRGFSEMDDGTKRTVLSVMGLTAVAAPLVTGLGNAVMAVGKAKEGFGLLMGTIEATGKGISVFTDSSKILSPAIDGISKGSDAAASSMQLLGSRALGAGGDVAKVASSSGEASTGILSLAGNAAKAAAAFVTANPLIVAAGASIAAMGLISLVAAKQMGEDSIPAIKIFGDGVTETTGKAAESVAAMETKTKASFLSIALSGKTATAEMRDGIVESFKGMADGTKEALDKQYNDARAALENRKGLNKEEQAENEKLISDLKASYDRRKDDIDGYEQQVKGIVQYAINGRRELTEGEITEMLGLIEKMGEDWLSLESTSQDNLDKLAKKYGEGRKRIAADTATEVVKSANEERDGIIKAANEEYEGKMEAAELLASEGTLFASSQAAKMVEIAEKERDDKIKLANSAYDKTITGLKAHNGDILALMDMQTGEVMSRQEAETARRELANQAARERQAGLTDLALAHEQKAKEISDALLGKWEDSVGELADHVVPEVSDSVMALTDAIVGGMDEILANAPPKMQEAVNGILEKLQKLPADTSAKDLKDTAITELEGLLSEAPPKMQEVVKQVLEALQSMPVEAEAPIQQTTEAFAQGQNEQLDLMKGVTPEMLAEQQARLDATRIKIIEGKQQETDAIRAGNADQLAAEQETYGPIIDAKQKQADDSVKAVEDGEERQTQAIKAGGSKQAAAAGETYGPIIDAKKKQADDSVKAVEDGETRQLSAMKAGGVKQVAAAGEVYGPIIDAKKKQGSDSAKAVEDGESQQAKAIEKGNADQLKAVEKGMGDITGAIAEGGKDQTAALEKTMEGSLKVVEDSNAKLVEAAKTGQGDFAKAISDSGADIEAAYTAILDSISDSSSKGMQDLKGSVEKSMGETAQAFEDALNRMDKANGDSIGKIAKELSDKITEAAKTVKEQAAAMREAFEKDIPAAGKAWEDSFTRMEQKAKEAMQNSLQAVKNGVNEIRSALSQTVQGPNIKLPHISVSGSFSVDPPKAPSFSLSWAAKGHVARSAQVLGVGEYLGAKSNPELISPVSTMKDAMAEVLDRRAEATVQSAVEASAFRDLAKAVMALAGRPVSLEVSGREIALATVGDMDAASGLRSNLLNRGLAL